MVAWVIHSESTYEKEERKKGQVVLNEICFYGKKNYYNFISGTKKERKDNTTTLLCTGEKRRLFTKWQREPVTRAMECEREVNYSFFWWTRGFVMYYGRNGHYQEERLVVVIKEKIVKEIKYKKKS